MCSADPDPAPEPNPAPVPPPAPAPTTPAEPADELAALKREIAEIRRDLAHARKSAAAASAPAPGPAASMSPRDTNPGGPPDIAALAQHARDTNDRRALLTYLRLKRATT